MELKQDPQTGWWTRGTNRLGEELQVVRMHPLSACEGRGCGMHNKPTLHPLYDAPLRWTTVLDRQCKHGIWHADHDEVLYYESIGRIRGCEDDCDSCCENWDLSE